MTSRVKQMFDRNYEPRATYGKPANSTSGGEIEVQTPPLGILKQIACLDGIGDEIDNILLSCH